jgi:hypothetical protein
LFKQSDVNQWFKGFDKAFSNLDRSIDTAGDNLEKHLEQRTNSTTPTDTYTLLNSRRFHQELDSDSFELVITYNEDGSAPYAITEHEDPYHHDFTHNSSEVRSRHMQPALYLYIPLIKEREDWWKKVFSKVRWK